MGAMCLLSSHRKSPWFLVFDLLDPSSYQFLNQCIRQWLIRGELDGSLRDGEVLQLVLEHLDHGRSWEQAAMVGERGKPYQGSFVLECRYPVADGLDRFSRRGGPNGRANFVQGTLGRFRDECEVFVNGLGSRGAFRGRTTIAGFGIFHASYIVSVKRST